MELESNKTNSIYALAEGVNQSDARVHNDRLILTLLRHQAYAEGGLAKAELSRMTGLSAQTLSLLMRRLEAADLVRPLERVKNGLGQPATPYQLNEEGAFSLGVKIGRRSIEIVMVNFVGQIIDQCQQLYHFPDPATIVSFTTDSIKLMQDRLGPRLSKRIIGIGLAMPFEIWNWPEQIHLPPGALDQWRNFDLEQVIQDSCNFPVMLINDASAACATELIKPIANYGTDYIYFYIGWFIGGGVVLGGKVYHGRKGNAGAVGGMLFSPKLQGERPDGPQKPYQQLLDRASLYLLEDRLIKNGKNPEGLWLDSPDWSQYRSELDPWLEETAEAIAVAIVNACSILDFQWAYLDGAFPPSVRARLVQIVKNKIESLDRRGFDPILIEEGAAGRQARALGAAIIPLLARYSLDHDQTRVPKIAREGGNPSPHDLTNGG